MVFSFFKKDPKGPKKGAGGPSKSTGPRTGGATEVQTRPTQKPIGRPVPGPATRAAAGVQTRSAAFPTTETALPDRERARNRALETAAKIDAIESEMARDLLRGLGRSTGGAQPTTVQPAAQPAPAPAPVPQPPAQPARPAPDDAAGPLSDMLGGDIDAIEINTSGAGSVIDETAILFSNGQAEEAEAVLRAGLRSDDLGPSTRMAWHMLFELINQRGDKAAFEQLTMDYVMRFEHSPPAWVDYVDAPAARPAARAAQAAPSGAPSVRLPATVDADIVKQLEQLRALTGAHAAVQLDLSDARSVDAAGADLLLRVLSAFKRSQRELTLVGAASFVPVLSRAIESGRRDPSDAAWMLLLELQRLLGRQDEFEETAIQYCITFEVSPPSWEPAPANLKVAAAAAGTAAGGGESAPQFELRGVIEGEGEPHFGRLVASARNHPQVLVDCSQLRRVAFSAGSAMLATLRKMQQGGSSVELHNVNALVAALLHLLGVTSVVAVQPRRG